MTQPIPIQKRPRKFVPQDFKITDWAGIEPLCTELLERTIDSVGDLQQWLADRSELEGVINEDHYRRYINKTLDTDNEEFDRIYNDFVENIQPELMKVGNRLNKKLVDSPYADQLDEARYHTYLRRIRNQIALFREENIPLYTKIDQTSKKYYAITGKMTIEHEGQELTLQQAARYFEEKDRDLRADIFDKVVARRAEEVDTLDALYDELIRLRHQVAVNAGFDNYRDYKLQELGRFDYGVAECEEFHDSIEKEIIPLVDKMMEQRRKELGLDHLKPYDTSVDTGETPLPVPFDDTDDLVERSIDCLDAVDPFFGSCLQTMKEFGHLDLDSRKGKAPGGYNCGLPETGVPFIFMNAAGTPGDVRTMVHEGGHAVHSFLMHDLDYVFDSNISSEMAELASMSMELFALSAYDRFYPEAEDRKRAIYSSIEDVVTTLPWLALIDKFQHWVYTHPEHTREERKAAWSDMYSRFSSSVVDRSGFEDHYANLWQKQLHLFMVPFYYIEYGIAQLGAVGMWRNYLEDPEKAIADYKAALADGSIITLPDMYRKAGVPFDFSRKYIRELTEFIHEKLNATLV